MVVKEKITTKEELQDFVKRNNYAGLDDLTDEEFEDVKKYSRRVALKMIDNKRKGLDKAKEYEKWKGIVLGGRDFVYKGIQVEDAKSQYVTVMMRDENNRPYLDEVTVFGHLKGVKHGDGTEMNIEIKEAVLKDKSTRINKTVRDKSNELPILKKGAITGHRDIKDSGIYLFQSGEISENNLYDIVAVEGVIANVDTCPVWSKTEEGQREGDHPINYNDQACIRLILLADGGPTHVRVNLNPKKFSDLFISWPEDFDEIIKSNDVQAALGAFIDAKVIVIGCIRKFDMSSNGNFATLDATAILVPDEIYATEEEKAGAQTTLDAQDTPSSEETPAQPSQTEESPDPPTKDTQTDENPKSKMDGYKSAVAELMDTLNNDNLEIEDVQNAKILPDDLAPQLIGGIIKAVKKSRSK